jgi:N-acetylglucosamine kinase-like BadF-type ATPase
LNAQISSQLKPAQPATCNLQPKILRMSNQCVIGVDGGQTSTKCALVASDGRVLGYGSGGGLVHLAAEGARERHIVALREAFASAWADAGIPPQPVAAIGLGLTGVEGGTAESEKVRGIVAEVIETRQVETHSDAYVALIGAHGGQPGIIAISGTGSHIMGLNAAGDVARAGGWGWLLGDEGSAFWLGKNGLAAALRAFDGVGEATLLESLMHEHFEVATFRDVKRLVYDSGFGAKGFAALASLVSRAAEEGDAIARGLIAQAARDLAAQVVAVQRRLALPDDTPVAPIGGAYEHVPGLRDGFVAALHASNPASSVVAPQLPPVLGAALIALRVCGYSLSPWGRGSG